MKENIGSMQKISLEKLNEHLLAYELLTGKSNWFIPVTVAREGKFLDCEATVSHGLHGGLFSICISVGSHYSHEEYKTEDEIPYTLFVPKDYLLPTFSHLTSAAAALAKS